LHYDAVFGDEHWIHPLRERGLQQAVPHTDSRSNWIHPLRERGLQPELAPELSHYIGFTSHVRGVYSVTFANSPVYLIGCTSCVRGLQRFLFNRG